MYRMTRNLGIAIALLLLAPLSAHALGISIVNVSSSGASTSVLQPGDTITFDLLLENNTLETLTGLGVDARGYDSDANGEVDDGLSFASGAVTSSIFSSVYVPGIGQLGGMDNVQNQPEERGFFNPITFQREEKRVSLYTGVSTSGADGNGSNDIGIQGLGGPGTAGGDVHFQITFQATPTQIAARAFTLDFGTNLEFGTAALGAGGVIIPFTGTQYSLTVIPEPGTALLMGLGLLGLSTTKRSSRLN